MWTTMFKKDVRILSTGWLVALSIMVVIVAAVATASYFGIIHPGIATTIGVILLVSNIFILPIHIFKGLNREMKGTPSLWFQTPASGWSMFASKLLSALLGAVIFLAVGYLLSLALFHIDVPNALAAAHLETNFHGNGLSFSWTASNGEGLTPEQLRIGHVVIDQIPRIAFYAAISFISMGLYIALWASMVYMSVQAVRNRLNKFRWLVGLVVVLVGTWGLGALEHTTLYQHLFDWGQISFLSLFPADVQSLLPFDSARQIPSITTGYVTFDILIMAILFYLTGRMIDRHVEV